MSLNHQAVYIGLGSNLNSPVEQLQRALAAIARLPETQLVAHSSFYGSKPVGPQDQPDYVNAVALLNTRLTPLSLLDALQTIETDQGLIRARRWGERTLDLDILLFGNQEISSERLTIPHAEMLNRDFVLKPLLELSPQLCLPNSKPIAPYLTNCADNQLIKLAL